MVAICCRLQIKRSENSHGSLGFVICADPDEWLVLYRHADIGPLSAAVFGNSRSCNSEPHQASGSMKVGRKVGQTLLTMPGLVPCKVCALFI